MEVREMKMKFSVGSRYKKPNNTKYFVIQLIVDEHELREDKDIAKQLELLTKTYRTILRKFGAKMKYESDKNILFDTVEELHKAVGYLKHTLQNNYSIEFTSFEELAQGANEKFEDLHCDQEEAKNFVKKLLNESKSVQFKKCDTDDGYIYGECTNEFVKSYKNLVPIITFEELIERSMSKIKTDWDTVCKFYMLDEEFMDDFAPKLNWILVSKYQNISLDFIRRHKDELDLDMISVNVKVPQKVKDEVLKALEHYIIMAKITE